MEFYFSVVLAHRLGDMRVQNSAMGARDQSESDFLFKKIELLVSCGVLINYTINIEKAFGTL